MELLIAVINVMKVIERSTEGSYFVPGTIRHDTTFENIGTDYKITYPYYEKFPSDAALEVHTMNYTQSIRASLVQDQLSFANITRDVRIVVPIHSQNPYISSEWHNLFSHWIHFKDMDSDRWTGYRDNKDFPGSAALKLYSPTRVSDIRSYIFQLTDYPGEFAGDTTPRGMGTTLLIPIKLGATE